MLFPRSSPGAPKCNALRCYSLRQWNSATNVDVTSIGWYKAKGFWLYNVSNLKTSRYEEVFPRSRQDRCNTP